MLVNEFKRQQGDRCGQEEASEEQAGKHELLRGAPTGQPHLAGFLTTCREKRDWKAELEDVARTSTKGCSRRMILLSWNAATGVEPSRTLSTTGLGSGNSWAIWRGREGGREQALLGEG